MVITLPSTILSTLCSWFTSLPFLLVVDRFVLGSTVVDILPVIVHVVEVVLASFAVSSTVVFGDPFRIIVFRATAPSVVEDGFLIRIVAQYMKVIIAPFEVTPLWWTVFRVEAYPSVLFVLSDGLSASVARCSGTMGVGSPWWVVMLVAACVSGPPCALPCTPIVDVVSLFIDEGLECLVDRVDHLDI